MNGSHGLNGTQAARKHVEKRSMGSHWSDSSHASWFNSLFDEFCEAVGRGDFAGKEAREAVLCVQLINTAYRSARNGADPLPVIQVNL